MILASAGSGKTYALTNRFVRLLALGAAPDRIVALTFTRKAAGEFFDEILKKLAHAASDEVFALRLAREIEEPQLRVSDFLRLLRAVVDAMHRLRLGTFDGFFARIARNFPLELGLTGEFEILHEHATQVERRRVLRRMFARSGQLADAQREFLEAFKRATFGADEKRLSAHLDLFLDRHQEVYLAAPADGVWGNPERIWPNGADWRETAAQRESAVKDLRAALAGLPLNDKQRARWDLFFSDLEVWQPGAPMGEGLEYLLGNIFKAWPELVEIVVDRKKLALPENARRSLRALVLAVVELEILRRLEMTRGLRAVLASYDAFYHDAVRRAGKLTFADVQRLLAPAEGAPVLSSSGDDEGRLAIDYRLDGEIDHWLLDEFQDTSYGQWSVLRNLIDEAVQDPSGTRSFFYVGDVKQAIFAWREGDPRLFREIFEHYNAIQPATIEEQHLVQSWRSGPAVIAAVNQVFGDAAVLTEMFPGTAAQTWNREWRAHESARPQVGGHVALLHADDQASRFSVALAVLQEINPLDRGLTCAVLVQNNATAAELADFLRREGGLPALAESDLHVCIDNPLGCALLSLVKAAAHPGDTLAWEHLQMTPFAAVLASDGIATREALTTRLLAELHAEGFERTLGGWARKVESALADDDAFTRERARQFAAAAALFDATGSRDIAEFIEFMERHTVRDIDTTGSVRVMTIHKSKGLGFDVVLLPDLEGIRLDCRRDGLAVQKSSDRLVEWVLDLPSKAFYEQDSVLAAHVRAAEADACYESLSLLYVAMTRAKRALYIVTKPVRTSQSRNFPKLLAETLGAETAPVRVGTREFAGAFEQGDAEWFTQVPLTAPEKAEAFLVPVLPEAERRRSPRLTARRASSGKSGVVAGGQMFSLHRKDAADFGTAVHALLAEVEWSDANETSRLAATWREREVAADVIEEAVACLCAPALQPIWSRSAVGRVEVWRERAFEVVLDGVWLSGVFDRVVVERDASGRPARVTVIDFKTDRAGGRDTLATLAARHEEQLNTYRHVAARLTGLATAEVVCEVVFTSLRQRAVVRNPARAR
jgi:ATP-dependent exoDNAse (exonuclease V) beta subunit